MSPSDASAGPAGSRSAAPRGGEPRPRSIRDPLAGLRDPVVLILVLAGTFDGLSGNPIHSILLFGVAVALAMDDGRRRRGVVETPSRPILTGPVGRLTFLGIAVVIVAYAAFVGGFPRYSWPVTVAVVVPGIAAIVLAWRGSIRRRAPTPRLEPFGIVAWLSVFLALALWELTQLLLQPTFTTDSQQHPTLSVLSDPILATHVGRSIGLALWAALGLFLLER